MNGSRNPSARAAALQAGVAIMLVAILAIFLATSFIGAPQRETARSIPNQSAPETVALPIANLDPSLPIGTVIDLPVMTTNVDPSEGVLGFQGDFTFDETVCTFSTPFVQPAGLTATGWNVSANILPGSGPIRRLRVSAFVADGMTPLSGTGILYNLRILRVTQNPPQSTLLLWQSSPDNFVFINSNLDTVTPTQTDGQITVCTGGACLTPTPGSCTTTTFSNHTQIDIPESGTSGIAQPYPSNIFVSGITAPIIEMSMHLNGLTHGHPKDVDVLLVGPQGQNIFIMSDAGGYFPVENVNLFLNDNSRFPLPDGGPLVSDSYYPTELFDCDQDLGDTFPAPAPVPSGFTAFRAFNGTDPNGTWSLYVVDDRQENTGAFSGGWDLTIRSGNCPSPSPVASPSPSPYPGFAFDVPNHVIAGVPFNFTLFPSGGPYSGTIHFTSSDPSAVLPADTFFNNAPVQFTATLNSVSSHQSITVTDTQQVHITETSICIMVDPATPTPTPTPTLPPTPTPHPVPSPSPFEGGTVLWESFDLVNPPVLPNGWNTVSTPGAANCTGTGTCPLATSWSTTANSPYSGPGVAFHNAPECVTDTYLQSPQFFLPGGYRVDIEFWHRYDLEPGRDGALLEVSIDGGPFNQIGAGYNGTISTEFHSPIGGRQAWTGSSGGYVRSGISLLHPTNPGTATLRFRLATDCSGSGVGWSIDQIWGHWSQGTQGTPTPTPTPMPPCTTTVLSNFSTIAIPASGSSGVSSPYPSTISVTGLGNSITRLNVSLHGVTHGHPKDIDALLVGPGGQNTILMSDAGGYGPIAGWELLLTNVADEAPYVLLFPLPNGGPIAGGTYAPANYADCDEVSDIFPAPAPNPSGTSDLSVFNGTNPNGTWSLYVVDDGEGNTGSLSGGWSLTIVTGVCPEPTAVPSPTPTAGPTSLVVTAPTTVTAGVPFNFTVAANWFCLGQIHFTSSDPQAVLPVDADLGCSPRTLSATLYQTGTNQTITATYPSNSFITGTSNCIVVQESVARALNLSTRLMVGTGNDVGIGGFIVTGSAPKYVLLRGIGPSLAGAGVPNPLPDPVLELHDASGALIIRNDNACDPDPPPGQATCAEIIATGIAPTNSLESVILTTLEPGAYTLILSGNNNGTGVGLVEIYDLSQASDSTLANISTRGSVGTAGDIVIAGFILGGGVSNDVVLLRGIGPSLAVSGITDALANPTLELRDASGTLIASNDDWQNGQSVSLPPSDPLESAIEITLSPGAYTALLSGVNNTTGVGLVEVFDRGTP